MTKRITLILTTAVLLLGAGAAIAQPGMMGGHGNQMGGHNQHGQSSDPLQRVLPMLHRLDLSSEQADEIRDIVEEARDEIQALTESEDRENMREQFIDLFTSSSITESQVEQLLDQRLEKMEQINEIVAGALVEIHGVLTPEQLEMIADFDPAEMHAGGQGGHAPMMPGGSRGGSRMGMHPPR